LVYAVHGGEHRTTPSDFQQRWEDQGLGAHDRCVLLVHQLGIALGTRFRDHADGPWHCHEPVPGVWSLDDSGGKTFQALPSGVDGGE